MGATGMAVNASGRGLNPPTRWVFNAYEGRRAFLSHRIANVRDVVTTLSEVSRELELLTTWRSHLVKWRERLQQELGGLGTDFTPTDVGRRQNLELSLATIDATVPRYTDRQFETLRLGALMIQSGIAPSDPIDGQAIGRLPWLGSLPDTERRLGEVEAIRVQVQGRLDTALLSDAERERIAKEDKQKRDASNAAPQRKTRGNGTRYDKYPDGRCVEVTLEAVTN